MFLFLIKFLLCYSIIFLFTGSCIYLTYYLFKYFSNCSKLKRIVTGHDILVRFSPKTKFITREELDSWGNEVITVWTSSQIDGFTYNLSKILDALHGTTVTFIDQDILMTQLKENSAEPVWGVTYYNSKTIHITTLALGNTRENIRNHIKSTYIHELSHLITGFVGAIWDTEKSHELFKRLGVY